MSSQNVIYLVAAVAGVLSLAAWAVFILAPAWKAYSRVWERILAAILSVYVLAAFVLVGALIGAGAVWYWDQV